jgi:hypothetical protein
MRFFISSYGHSYIPYLSICLSTLITNHSDNSVVDVFLEDTPEYEVLLLKNLFSEVKFNSIVSHASQYSDINQKIPAKLEHWLKYMASVPDGETVVFLDADLLIKQNITSALPGKFDFLYTWKDENWPLNVGVVIVKSSTKTIELMQLWHRKTLEIISSPRKLKEACDKSGAADQAALLEIMGVMESGLLPQGSWNKDYEFGNINFYGAPCADLNQTNSVPVNSGTRIFHYKGGWKDVINYDGLFSRNRPRSSSYEMYSFWENTYQLLNKRALNKFILSHSNDESLKASLSKENYEERGILNSEIYAIIKTIKTLGVQVLIESGRARAQSTYVLGKYLEDFGIKIHSIEFARDEDAIFGEKRVSGLSNVSCHYGNSNDIVPKLLRENQDKKVALLIDGPKGEGAYKLAEKSLLIHNNIPVIFIHDLKKLVEGRLALSRFLIDKYFDRIFFTDDKEYVSSTEFIDINSSHIPYHKELWYQESYGPTLAIIFPTKRDRCRALSKQKSMASLMQQKVGKILSGVSRALTRIYPFDPKGKQQAEFR